MFKIRLLSITLIITLILVLSVSGCGGGNDEAGGDIEKNSVEEPQAGNEQKNQDKEQKEHEEPSVTVKNWRNPTEINEIVKNFKELEWTWARIKDGKETDSTAVSYRYGGSETVKGSDTNLLVFVVDNEKFKLWIDKNGEAVQAEIKGKIIPGEFVNSAMEDMLSGIFWPFLMVDKVGIREAIMETTPGVEWTATSTDREQFGDLDAKVTRIEVDLGPPITPENKEGKVIWSVGDFDGNFQMLVGWEANEEALESDLSITYTLNNVVPR
ncbi:MAG: hypothetical protein K9L17_09890 [Clostridiales bacterium]|nr:hypothetical protein [Clostridiales bacterium]MCF8022990.1 hypothetical protein [Clostridiales bacterium]